MLFSFSLKLKKCSWLVCISEVIKYAMVDRHRLAGKLVSNETLERKNSFLFFFFIKGKLNGGILEEIWHLDNFLGVYYHSNEIRWILYSSSEHFFYPFVLLFCLYLIHNQSLALFLCILIS